MHISLALADETVVFAIGFPGVSPCTHALMADETGAEPRNQQRGGRAGAAGKPESLDEGIRDVPPEAIRIPSASSALVLALHA